MTKHHNPDYAKNRSADVIKKGTGRAVPNEHWEMKYTVTPEGNNSAWGAFLPKKGPDSPVPHVKINKYDY